MTGEISLAVFKKNRETLIIWRPGGERWSLPGGKARLGEGPREALFRELGEQFTDLRIHGSPVVLLHFESIIGKSQAITIFLTDVSDIVVPNPQEIADARWIDPLTAKHYQLSDEENEALNMLQELQGRSRCRPPKILD